MKGKYLITTDAWFIAPDGKQYRAAWGECNVFGDKDSLGIETNSKSTNWYVKCGHEKKEHIIIAGCQIHYAIKCDYRPNGERVTETIEKDDQVIKKNTDCRIYFFD